MAKILQFPSRYRSDIARQQKLDHTKSLLVEAIRTAEQPNDQLALRLEHAVDRLEALLAQSGEV